MLGCGQAPREKDEARMRDPKLPAEFICFDTEYTTWLGALERGWSGPNEYREIVQIGAVLVLAHNLAEVDHFMCFAAPVKNPQLSYYFTQLTGITQEMVDKHGTPYTEALHQFHQWAKGLPLYSWGDTDLEVMHENARLLGISCPIPLEQGTDIRKLFRACGVDPTGYNSSTIPKAFGEEPPPSAHDALNDARSILQGLRALARR